MNCKILLDGADITDKVTSFSISYSMESFCSEVRISVADPSLFSIDYFTTISEAPQLEVLVNEDGSGFVSLGTFFAESPSFSEDPNRTYVDSVWGRGPTARLTAPWAPKMNYSVDTDKTFFDIVEELCEQCGVEWNVSDSDADCDFLVFGGTYSATQLYPIDIISELASFNLSLPTCDRQGRLLIKKTNYDLSGTAVATISDETILEASVSMERPEFGNRVLVTAVSGGGRSLVMFSSLEEDPCLIGDGVATITVQLMDGNTPVSGVPVSFSSKYGRVVIDPDTIVTAIIQTTEKVQASNKYEASLSIAPTRVVAVYSVTRGYNLGDFVLEGNTVRFNTPLVYCDEVLSITYELDGAGTVTVRKASEAIAGIDEIVARAEDQTASLRVVVDDPCACRPNLQVMAEPSSIYVGDYSNIIALATYGNGPIKDGRTIWWTVLPKSSTQFHGYLQTTQSNLGRIRLYNFAASITAQEEGSSYIYYATLPVIPYRVIDVRQTTTDCPGSPVSYEWNSDMGSRIKITSTNIKEGAWACVDFEVQGAALNKYTGTRAGVDAVRAIIKSDFVEPIAAEAEVTVTRVPPPDDEDCLCPDPGYCKDGIEEDAYYITCVDGKKKLCPKCKNEDPPCDCPDLGYCPSGVEYYSFKCPDGSYKQCLKCKGKDPPCPCPNTGVCENGTDGYLYKCPNGTTQACKKCKGKDPPPDPKPDQDDKPPEDLNKGDEGPEDPNWNGKEADLGKGDCYGKKCESGQSCCQHTKTKEMGCWPTSECDTSGRACLPDDVWTNPTPENIQARFANVLSREGCTCEDACRAEVSHYGTTPSYDNASGVTIEDLLAEQGWTGSDEDLNNPDYWAAYTAIEQEMIDACMNDCGVCEDAPELTLSGPTEVLAPGSYQYSVSGGVGGIEFSIEESSSSGVSVDGSGKVSLTASACGSFIVRAEDACGQEAKVEVKITNQGIWTAFLNFVESYGGNISVPCQSGSYWLSLAGHYIVGGDDTVVGIYKIERQIQSAYASRSAGCDNPDQEALKSALTDYIRSQMGDVAAYAEKAGPLVSYSGNTYYYVGNCTIRKWGC